MGVDLALPGPVQKVLVRIPLGDLRSDIFSRNIEGVKQDSSMRPDAPQSLHFVSIKHSPFLVTDKPSFNNGFSSFL